MAWRRAAIDRDAVLRVATGVVVAGRGSVRAHPARPGGTRPHRYHGLKGHGPLVGATTSDQSSVGLMHLTIIVNKYTLTAMTRKTQLALATGIGSLSLILAACGSTSDSDSAQTGPADSINVVTTTTILGNVVDDIVTCAGGTNTTIMPIGADPHDFSPSSSDVAAVVQADVVISNGLGLEEGLTDALQSAREDGAEVIEVAELVDPIPFGEGDDHSEGDDHGHDDLDPHFWFDMSRMAAAAVIIGDDLAARSGQDFADCGQQVSANILTAQDQLINTLADIPTDRRVLVTDHDALEYFAQAYDFRVVGSVIPAGTTLAEPSSAQLQELVATIQAENVPAIFSNSAEPAVLAEAVAAESGNNVIVVPLFVGSLGGPDSGAATYIAMMETNATRIADALRN